MVDEARPLQADRVPIPGRPPVYYQRSAPPGTPTGALVLLHGLASNASRWSEFARTTRLREDWLLLRPDLRGHGRSMDHGSIGLDRWADDLALLLDHEEIGSAVVVGHCLGAAIGQRFAMRHPERVSGLVLVEPLYPEALRPRLGRLRTLSALLRPLIASLRLAYRVGLRRRSFRRPDLERLDRETRAAIAGGVSGEDALRQYGSPWTDLHNLPLANYLESLLATVEEPAPGRILACPILAILSSGSVLGDSARTRERLAAFPACRIEVLDANHWLPTERPVELRRLIEEWCLSLRFGARG